MRKPLEGLLVIALEQAVAAPYCSSRLADAGARVIKVERTEGDFARNYDHVVHGESAYFVWLNRGNVLARTDVEDLILHPQLRRTQVDSPSGPVSLVSPPCQSSRQTVQLIAVPGLGEHTELLRKEFS